MNSLLIVCMGVSGSGKSTCAQILAATFDLVFIEADDFHSESNKQKMQAGQALTDADRTPWMSAICEQLEHYAKSGIGCVLAHSGLKKAHRQQLRTCGLQTLFLHLDAPQKTIAQRMSERENHFMPTELLSSQFNTLQSTKDERDVIRLDATLNRYKLMTRATATVDHFIAIKKNEYSAILEERPNALRVAR